MCEEKQEEQEELDYQDDNGDWWIMAACGHRVGGAVKGGDKITLCPNCRFSLRFGNIIIAYPDRLPEGWDKKK